jgi:hypothetical protein
MEAHTIADDRRLGVGRRSHISQVAIASKIFVKTR